MKADQSWDRVLDTTLDGLVHKLNGRVAGLSGILQVAQMRGGFDAELFALLGDEVERLQELTAAARDVPRSTSHGSAASLASAVDAALRLRRLTAEPVVDVQGEVPDTVVACAEGELVRCLLLLFAADPGGSVLRVSVSGDVVLLQLQPKASPAVAVSADLTAAAARCGGSAEPASNAVVTVRLPAVR